MSTLESRARTQAVCDMHNQGLNIQVLTSIMQSAIEAEATTQHLN